MQKEKKRVNFKKVLSVLMALTLFVLPFGGLKVFAYSGVSALTGTNYLLDNSSIYSLSSSNVSNFLNLMDNNLTTTTSFGTTGVPTVRIDFAGTYNITSVYYEGNKYSANAWFKFYDSNNVSLGTLYTDKFSSSVHEYAVNYTGVKYAVLAQSSSTTLTAKEIDFTGSPNITHDEITVLTSSVNGNSVALNYSIPSSNSAYTGSKIYRNGTLIATNNRTTSSYVDSGLAWNSNHTYKVTALYNDGYETTGATNSISIGSRPVDQTYTENVTISAGSNIQSQTALTFSSVALDLTKSQTATGSHTITVKDDRGSATGWSLNLSATDFTSGSLIDPTVAASTYTVKFPASQASVAWGTVTATTGQAVHGTYGPYKSDITLSNSSQSVLNASPGYGMGIYTVTGTFAINVPKTVTVATRSNASSKYNVNDVIGTVATTYTSTLTYTLGAGI